MQVLPLTDPRVSFSFAERWGSSRALARLIDLAYRAGSKSVAEFETVRSPEWQREYDAVLSALSNWLQGDPKLLVFTNSDLMGANEEEVVAELKAGRFSGYAIVRPAPLCSVLEALMCLKPTTPEHYLTAQCTRSVEFQTSSGEWHTLAARGTPFMQQDGQASCCAHASLWLAAILANDAFGLIGEAGALSCDQVAEALCSDAAAIGRRVPPGLRMEEIVGALERSGYVAVSYPLGSPESSGRADQIVYRYVESGIPVILILQLEKGARHSAVVCGHTFDPDAWWPGARETYFPSLAGSDPWLCSALWTPEYLLLDDNYGPALAITRGGVRNRATIAIAVWPQSANIFMRPDHAEMVAAGTLFSEGAVLPLVRQASLQFPNPWTNWLRKAIVERTDKLVLRTTLASPGEIAKHLSEEDSYSAIAKNIFKQISLPERVWMVEVSAPALYGQKRKVGEVLLHAQVPPGLFKVNILAIHLSGWIWAPVDASVTPVGCGDEPPARLIGVDTA